MWTSNVKHNVTNDVVVESKGGLLRQARYEADEMAEQFKHLVLVVAGETLEHVPEE